jgi:hypothetical protein
LAPMASPAANTDPDGAGVTKQRRRKRNYSSEQGEPRSAKKSGPRKGKELWRSQPGTTSPPSERMKMLRSVQAKMESNRSRLPCQRGQAGRHPSTLRCHLLAPWCKILFEKLTVTQLVKNILLSCGTRRFITVYTQARHWTLS